MGGIVQENGKLTSVGIVNTLVSCGVVWCGVVWCDVVWCGVVWCAHPHVKQRFTKALNLL